MRSSPRRSRPTAPSRRSRGAEWLTISGFSQPYDVCLDWPKPFKRPPRLPAVKLPASVPILIVGGDLDSLTPLLDAPVFGPKLGENVEIVPLRNTVHVTSQGGDFLVEGMRCARTVIRSFLRGMSDATCAAEIPALHTPKYAPAPATLVSGPDPGEAARRFAAIGVQAFADAVFRRYYSGVDRGPGLRGGTFTARGDTYTLRDIRFTPDVTVSGTGRWDASTGGARVDLTVGERAADRRVDAADAAGHRPDRRRRTLDPGTLMDTFLAIASRREVRAYDGRPLPEDAVRRILEAGRLAGSSKNRQQRHFVVLRDHEAAAQARLEPGEHPRRRARRRDRRLRQGAARARRRPRRAEHAARRAQRGHRRLPERAREPGGAGHRRRRDDPVLRLPGAPERPDAPQRRGMDRARRPQAVRRRRLRALRRSVPRRGPAAASGTAAKLISRPDGPGATRCGVMPSRITPASAQARTSAGSSAPGMWTAMCSPAAAPEKVAPGNALVSASISASRRRR